jgi:hypothetical protein
MDKVAVLRDPEISGKFSFLFTHPSSTDRPPEWGDGTGGKEGAHAVSHTLPLLTVRPSGGTAQGGMNVPMLSLTVLASFAYLVILTTASSRKLLWGCGR